MSSIPQVIDQIVQFTGASTTEWNNVLVPIPDKMLIITTDGSVRRGDGQTLFADLPELFNTNLYINFANIVNNKADKGHRHTASEIDGLALAPQDILDGLLANPDTHVLTDALLQKLIDLQPAESLSTTLEAKADKATLDQLSQTVATKADASALTAKLDKTGGTLTNGTIAGGNLNNTTATGTSVRGATTPVVDHGTISSGSVTLDPKDGHYHKLKVTTNAVVGIIIPWEAGKVCELIIEIADGGSGIVSFSPTANFITATGQTQSNPPRALQASGIDLLALEYNGSTMYAKVL